METKEIKTVGGWFCSYCQRGVDPSEVTFRETHEVCGRMVANDEPPAVDIVTQCDSLLSVNKQLLEALEGMERVYEHGDFETEFKPALKKARAAILAALEQGDVIGPRVAETIRDAAEKALTCRVKPTFRAAA